MQIEDLSGNHKLFKEPNIVYLWVKYLSKSSMLTDQM